MHRRWSGLCKGLPRIRKRYLELKEMYGNWGCIAETKLFLRMV